MGLFWQLSNSIEYRNLVAPLSHLPKEVLEETFMNGLNPLIKAEARIDWACTNHEISPTSREAPGNEAGFGKIIEGKAQTDLNFVKPNFDNDKDTKPIETLTMRTITPRGATMVGN